MMTAPPLTALRAFHAYARFGSVAAAGASLNVSHAAISQHLRSLEQDLGAALFDRSGRALRLTEAGEDLARGLARGFDAIDETVARFRDADTDRPVNIACTPTFAVAWLMPRLASFRSENPEIDLVLTPDPKLTDPATGGIDIALRYGTGPWQGLDAIKLLDAPVVVVGAPSLFPNGLPDEPEALLSLPWLEELGLTEGMNWLMAQGVPKDAPRRHTELPGHLMIEAARQGQGIAVTTRLAVQEDINAGRLLVAFEDRLDAGYHILTRPGVLRPPVKLFRSWLLRQRKG